MTSRKTTTTKGRSGKGKGEVNHAIIAWALAGVLTAQPEGEAADVIIGTANRLGAASGEVETFDLRAEVMLREILDGHTSCAYKLEGQDGRKGKRAYDKLVALAGGAEGSPEPKDKNSCAWACWTMRRLRAELTSTIRENYTEPEYIAFGKPRMEVGVLFHILQGSTWREFNTAAVLQMLGPLVTTAQVRAWLARQK